VGEREKRTKGRDIMGKWKKGIGGKSRERGRGRGRRQSGTATVRRSRKASSGAGVWDVKKGTSAKETHVEGSIDNRGEGGETGGGSSGRREGGSCRDNAVGRVGGEGKRFRNASAKEKRFSGEKTSVTGAGD